MKTRQQRLDTPIFVGGASSSGTTLLARMFNRHPDVFCGGEMSLFNKERIYADFRAVKRKLPNWLKRGLPTDGYHQYFNIIYRTGIDMLTPDILIRFASEADSLREFADRIQAYCLHESGNCVFAEKTPSDVYCFRQLARLYPNCLLIHVVRDGRDVVCSLMKRGNDVFKATSIWLYNTACGIGCRDLSNYMEVGYEELVKDPPTVLRRICERASIPYDPCMLQPQEGEQASPFALAGSWKNCASEPVSQQSVGRYKTDLNDSDYATLCSVQLTKTAARKTGTSTFTAFDLLRTLGYAAEPPGRQPSWIRAKFLATRDHFQKNSRFIRKAYLPRRALTQVSLRPADRTRITTELAGQHSAQYGHQALAKSA